MTGSKTCPACSGDGKCYQCKWNKLGIYCDHCGSSGDRMGSCPKCGGSGKVSG